MTTSKSGIKALYSDNSDEESDPFLSMDTATSAGDEDFELDERATLLSGLESATTASLMQEQGKDTNTAEVSNVVETNADTAVDAEAAWHAELHAKSMAIEVEIEAAKGSGAAIPAELQAASAFITEIQLATRHAARATRESSADEEQFGQAPVEVGDAWNLHSGAPCAFQNCQTLKDVTPLCPRALLNAIQARNRAEALALLCLPGPLPGMNDQTTYGYSLLHWAGIYNLQDVGLAILRRHDFQQVNAVDSWGTTALHHAAERMQLALCTGILQHPDFNMAEARGRKGFWCDDRTALEAAEHSRLTTVVDLLASLGCASEGQEASGDVE